MANQSACRSARSGYPATFTERSVSRQNRTGQGYSEQFPIGMTYTPMQSWENLYCPSQALEHGTLFADLDKPFLGRRVSR